MHCFGRLPRTPAVFLAGREGGRQGQERRPGVARAGNTDGTCAPLATDGSCTRHGLPPVAFSQLLDFGRQGDAKGRTVLPDASANSHGRRSRPHRRVLNGNRCGVWSRAESDTDRQTSSDSGRGGSRTEHEYPQRFRGVYSRLCCGAYTRDSLFSRGFSSHTLITKESNTLLIA